MVNNTDTRARGLTMRPELFRELSKHEQIEFATVNPQRMVVMLLNYI